MAQTFQYGNTKARLDGVLRSALRNGRMFKKKSNSLLANLPPKTPKHISPTYY